MHFAFLLNSAEKHSFSLDFGKFLEKCNKSIVFLSLPFFSLHFPLTFLACPCIFPCMFMHFSVIPLTIFRNYGLRDLTYFVLRDWSYVHQSSSDLGNLGPVPQISGSSGVLGFRAPSLFPSLPPLPLSSHSPKAKQSRAKLRTARQSKAKQSKAEQGYAK